MERWKQRVRLEAEERQNEEGVWRQKRETRGETKVRLEEEDDNCQKSCRGQEWQTCLGS